MLPSRQLPPSKITETANWNLIVNKGRYYPQNISGCTFFLIIFCVLCVKMENISVEFSCNLSVDFLALVQCLNKKEIWKSLFWSLDWFLKDETKSEWQTAHVNFVCQIILFGWSRLECKIKSVVVCLYCNGSAF